MVQLAVVRFDGCRCGQQVGNLLWLVGKERSGGNVGDFVQIVQPIISFPECVFVQIIAKWGCVWCDVAATSP